MRKIQKKQILLAGLIGGTTLFLCVLLIGFMDESPVTPDPPPKSRILTAGQRINPQEIWVERIEGENKLTQKKLDALEKLMTAQVKSTQQSEGKVQQLEQELEGLKGQKSLESTAQSDVSDHASLSPATNLVDLQEQNMPGIKKITLNLSGNSPQGKKQEVATPENTLPAGTFAKAVLLGGVDASTAISAPSDPRPVLLRITDKGTLPRKFCSDLKECHILASSYGDLSSERVYMRLEKLTCTERLTGEISETQVAGYVSGEDGKAGVRGVIVDRAGPLIRNSLIGGFFSGIGTFFEHSKNQLTLPMTSFGGINPFSPQAMLSAGAASGTSKALEKYAEFFMKRAEQLQPILQVAAGREVDIVFTQGTRFGETSVRKTLSKIRNESRKQAVQSLETDPLSQSWLPKGEE